MQSTSNHRDDDPLILLEDTEATVLRRACFDLGRLEFDEKKLQQSLAKHLKDTSDLVWKAELEKSQERLVKIQGVATQVRGVIQAKEAEEEAEELACGWENGYCG
jgi:flagellar capping protein FliD